MKEIDTKIISSIVGPKAASVFISNAAKRKILSGREILAGFDKAKVKDTLAEYGIHQLSVVNEGIYRHLEVEKVQDKDIKKYSENLMSYFEYLTKNRKEAAAHFANIYVQKTYQSAIGFIAQVHRVKVMVLVGGNSSLTFHVLYSKLMQDLPRIIESVKTISDQVDRIGSKVVFNKAYASDNWI